MSFKFQKHKALIQLTKNDDFLTVVDSFELLFPSTEFFTYISSHIRFPVFNNNEKSICVKTLQNILVKVNGGDLLTISEVALLYFILDGLSNSKYKPHILHNKLQILMERAKLELINELGIINVGSGDVERLHVQTKPKKSRAWLWIIAILGTMWTACAGFDGITSFLGLFLPETSFIVYFFGITFAILSTFIYYGFDLEKISHKLETPLIRTKNKLAYFTKQQRALERGLNTLRAKCLHIIETNCKDKIALLQEIKHRHKLLKAISRSIFAKHASIRDVSKSDSWGVWFSKKLVAVVAGIIFSANGFFVGQSIILWIFGMKLSVAIAIPVLFTLIIVLGTVCAAAAFCSFWYMEKLGMYALVDKLKGYPPKLVQEFINKHNQKRFDSLFAELKNAIDAVQHTYPHKPSRAMIALSLANLDVFAKPVGSINVNNDTEISHTIQHNY